MSKTVAELVSWLKSQDAIRMVLVEVEGVTGSGAATLYLSSKPYNTSAGVGYDPCIIGGLSFNESISLDGSPSIGYGDIEILNYDGSRDSWLTWVWANRQVKIFVGDPRWPRDDFYNIFTGVISDITTSSQTSLNLVLLNKLDRLNNPISEKTLGSLYPKVGEPSGIAGNENRPVGAVQNRDSILPLCFGECFNVTPLLISSAFSGGTTSTLTYMVHDGPIQEILEVRDNGIPITAYTADLTKGIFTLDKALAGVITCSVQGLKLGGTYLDKIADIIPYIAQNYGPIALRFAPADIYMLPTAIAKTAAVGVYITDRDNIIDVCTRLVSSVGGYITCNYTGTLIIGFLDLPGATSEMGTPTEITPDNIVLNSLSISEKPTVRGTVKLGYCYNWTDQLTGLAGGVPQSSQDLFSKPWMFITKTDAAVISEYKLDTQPVEEETYLLEESAALAEATRRLALWKEPRFVYSVDGFSELLALQTGMAVTISGYRFGLDTEKDGVVVSTDKDWVTCRVKIGVLV